MSRLLLAGVSMQVFLLPLKLCLGWSSIAAHHNSLTRLRTFPRLSTKLTAYSGSVALQDARKQSEFHSINLAYPGLEQIHVSPDVYLVRDFLAVSECAALIDCALNASSLAETDNNISNSAASVTASQTTPSPSVEEASSGPNGQLQTSSAPRAQLNSAKLAWLIPLIALAALPRALSFVAQNPMASSYEVVVSACLPVWFYAGTIAAALVALAPQVAESVVSGSSRTSESASLAGAQQSSPAYAALVSRVRELLNGADARTFEAPVATRYLQGQRFLAHNDASANPEQDWGHLGGQRVVTIITYLNDVPKGGRTVFPNLYAPDPCISAPEKLSSNQRQPLAITPQRGSALVFFPAAVASGQVDESTVHYAEEAVDEKWVCQVWKRQRAVPAPLGLAEP